MTILGVAPPIDQQEVALRTPAALPLDRPGHRAHLPGATPNLWHYTCDHAVASIVACGALVPYPHPYFPGLAPVVWLTSQADPDRYDVGLTADFVACDRLAHRFLVLDMRNCVAWLEVVAEAPIGALDPRVVRWLGDGRRPETWWLSAAPVPVVLA